MHVAEELITGVDCVQHRVGNSETSGEPKPVTSETSVISEILEIKFPEFLFTNSIENLKIQKSKELESKGFEFLKFQLKVVIKKSGNSIPKVSEGTEIQSTLAHAPSFIAH